MKRTIFKQHATGKAGEYRVASELILRGCVPAFPAIDLGCDLMIDHGVRIQVKSMHLTKCGRRVIPHYYFTPSIRRVTDKKQYVILKDRKMSDECDFVVAWGINENRFWIIPAHLLDGKMSVSLGQECYFKGVDRIKVLQMRAEGKTYREISETFGFSINMVWMIASGRRDGSNRYPDTKAIRDCEGRWDYITEHIADLSGGRKVFEQQTVATTP